MPQKKPSILFLITLIVIGLFIIGCNKSSVDEKKIQQITYNLGTEPETLDPATATGRIEATVQMALFEGLTRLDENNKPVPGIAKDWKVNKEGTNYIFCLRDAKWTNGDLVTAYDFEYAWKRLLNPDTGANYAYQLWFLKNGEEYTKGKVSADEVGVKALDEKTLEVELKVATPHFLSLTAFPSLYPVNKNIVESNPNWHTKPETFVGNGPFKLVQWEHNQQIVLAKNPTYWANEDVKLDKLIMTMIGEQNTELTMFETNQIDIAEDPPLSEIRRLLDEGTASLHPEISTYFYSFNTDNPVLGDKNVRRALSMAIDRQSLIDNIAQASQKPALAFVPYGIPGKGKDFREEGGNYFEENVEKARELLALAGYPNGEDFPVLELLCVARGNHQRIAEAIQEMWLKNLNIRVKITNQEWKVYLQSLIEGNYQIAIAVWGTDYIDALSFMDVFISDGSNNVANWSNKEYDRLIEIAQTNDDPKARIEAMHDAEKILIDEMPIMPIYFFTNVNMYKPWVKGVIVPVIGGFQEFRWAYISK
ncbi:MAG: oligopeptide transport system substrate-binding protein [Clostridia bacterium]|jgi:oligopeptide transport system substrate-binding protein|nr:oligopeptide transport system substrate-binding protein [Clostridia bacterium]MDN5323972.1 oligopeptide transport system substrate-binding protein [Clostridia bacterium]